MDLSLIIKQIKSDFEKNNIKDYNWEDLSKEIDNKINSMISKKWAVGFKDRGMGRGDYGIIVEGEETLIFECGLMPDFAQHIVEIHNANLDKSNTQS